MGRIDDSLQAIESIDDSTERAFQLAGLISTLFKIKGVVLVVTGQLAFDSYANSSSSKAELDLATFSGKLTPRLLQEVMVEQLGAKGLFDRWKVANIPVHFHGEAALALPDLCRDFMTDHGVAKLYPAEEMTAQRILAAVYPAHDDEAYTQARLLLINALSEAFQMDWAALQNICHQPDYRIGEDLAKMRALAKKDVDSLGLTPDPLAAAPMAAPVSVEPEQEPVFSEPVPAVSTPPPMEVESPIPTAIAAPTPAPLRTPFTPPAATAPVIPTPMPTAPRSAPPPLPATSAAEPSKKKSNLLSEDLMF